MKLEVKKTRFTIDFVGLSSDERRELGKDFKDDLGRYRFERFLALNRVKGKDRLGVRREYRLNKAEMRTYRGLLRYVGESGNVLAILCDRGISRFLPLISLRFFSSWEHPLTYSDVVGVCNFLSTHHSIGLNLSGFHLACDLFLPERDGAGSEETNDGMFNPNAVFDYLASHTKSRRSYKPVPKFRKKHSPQSHPGSYYWHSEKSVFTLILYNKKRQLLNTKKFKGEDIAGSDFNGMDAYRFELRFNEAKQIQVDSLEALGDKDFSFAYPTYLQFLQPSSHRLEQRGFQKEDFESLSIAELRKFFEARLKTTNNLFYYLEEITSLAKAVRDGLKIYRWRKPDESLTIVPPEPIFRHQHVEFVKIKM